MALYQRVQKAVRRRARKAVEPIYSRLEKPLYARGILSVRRSCLPDFLCIGAMKAGTTWLYENLRCHPALYLPDRKEDYFFSYQFHKQSLRQYSRRFAKGADKVKGEITPGYSILPIDRIRFIRSIMPDAKLILLLRDPIHRTWSEAYMNLAAKRNRRYEDVTKEEFLSYFVSKPCEQRSDYLTILDNWLSVFPRERLFLGLYEDIETSPLALLSAVFTHLDVSTDVDMSVFPFKRVVTPNYESYGGVHRGRLDEARTRTSSFLPGEFRDFLAQRYADRIQTLHERYGVPVERWSLGAV